MHRGQKVAAKRARRKARRALATPEQREQRLLRHRKTLEAGREKFKLLIARGETAAEEARFREEDERYASA